MGLGESDKKADILGVTFTNRVMRFLPDLPENSLELEPDYIDFQRFGNEYLGIDEDLTLREGYNPRYYSPFVKNPLYVRDGLFKQVLGLTKSPPSSALLKEMNRLAINQYEVYKRHTRSNFIDIVTRTSLSATLTDDFINEVQYSEKYSSLMKYEDKKFYLENWLKNKISQRKNTIRELANNGKFEYASDYTSFVRGEISSIKNQKQFNRFLKMRSPDYGSSNNSLSDFFNALKNIEELPRKEQYDLSASILIQVQDLYKEFQSEFPDAQPTGVDTVFN